MSDPGPRGGRGDPVARSGGPGRGIAVAQARAIAGRGHRGQIEPSGRPFLAHVRRVARAVPPFARGVAWLHDVPEWTGMLEEDLVAAGLSPHERAALRLLTRGPHEVGAIARAVKRADIEARHPRHPGARWSPPYDRARSLLAELAPPALAAAPGGPCAPPAQTGRRTPHAAWRGRSRPERRTSRAPAG